MSAEKLYIEKELSWLSFNERVLQEAADKTAVSYTHLTLPTMRLV